MAYISSTATSVVIPGSGLPRRPVMLAITSIAANASAPAGTSQGPSAETVDPATAPNKVISANVRTPATRDAARSRCIPTSSPNTKASPSLSRVDSKSMSQAQDDCSSGPFTQRAS